MYWVKLPQELCYTFYTDGAHPMVFPDTIGLFADLNELFPTYICEALKEGIDYFGLKIKNYDNDDVILAGVESRTSSPIKIERNEILQSNIVGIYPCGEGAGYAGGITTSAIDGLKIAELIAKKYLPIRD